MQGTLRALLDQWELAVQARGYSTGYISIVRLSVGLFADFLPSVKEVEAITADDFRRFLADLRTRPPKVGRKKQISSITINTYARMIKAFFSLLVQDQILTTNPLVLVPSPKKTKTIPKIYMEDDLIAVIRTAEKNTRDMAVLLLFLDSGIRLKELSSASLGNLDTKSGSVKVLGKGGKERFAYFSQATAGYLDRYINELRPVGQPDEPIFLLETGHALTARGIQSLLLRLGKKAGISERLSPHKLRHTWATLSLKNGGNLEYIRKLLGHTDIKTTAESYLNVQDAEVQEAYRKFSPVANILSKEIKGQIIPDSQKPDNKKGGSGSQVAQKAVKPSLSTQPTLDTLSRNTLQGGTSTSHHDPIGNELKPTYKDISVLQGIYQQLYKDHLQKLTDLTKILILDVENGKIEWHTPRSNQDKKLAFGGLGPVFSAQNNYLWPFLLQHLNAEFTNPRVTNQIAELISATLLKLTSYQGIPVTSLKDALKERLLLVIEKGTFKGTCEICAAYFGFGSLLVGAR